jgi:WD40 repeat protein
MLPCGTRFVSVSDDETVKLWTLDGTLERTIVRAPGEPVDDEVVVFVAICVAALPDGVHFAVGDNQDEIHLYHVDGTLVHTFKGHTRPVFSLAVTPDGQHIISGDSNGPVKVWHVATKSLVTTCVGHAGWVWAIAVMPDGQRFLSGSEDSTIRVWLLNGTHQKTFTLHDSRVNALVALHNNQHALSGSNDGRVKLFNVDDGAVLRTFRHHLYFGPVTVTSLALLPDGLRFVSGSNDDSARIVYHGLAPH